MRGRIFLFIFLFAISYGKDDFSKEWKTIEELGSFLTVLERCNCSSQKLSDQLAQIKGQEDLLGCDCCWNGPLGTACLCPTKLKFKSKFIELSSWLLKQKKRKADGREPNMMNFEAAEKSLAYNMGQLYNFGLETKNRGECFRCQAASKTCEARPTFFQSRQSRNGRLDDFSIETYHVSPTSISFGKEFTTILVPTSKIKFQGPLDELELALEQENQAFFDFDRKSKMIKKSGAQAIGNVEGMKAFSGRHSRTMKNNDDEFELVKFPEKLLKIMTDELISPQNALSFDRAGANREELISGEREKPLKRCLPLLVPLRRTMRTWGVKERMRCADPFVRSMLNVAVENPYFIRAVWQGEKNSTFPYRHPCVIQLRLSGIRIMKL
ncbi:Oidioi.mRNA.OKI2018_I69.chr2.g4681.t1.cds [Oikopleura dioica]|uniref:Oidioi.mRNA.OKI2018_I69.chr2.g4681.t1.cds n=1 Tax=Oikopleura dioica TaxID=34765 RepID=A0ABN7SZP3_OIKDI|nr:Oidioi.mRNA.OKI2018_I69.chr2.g4681.t1.cds [Oikopleura dioica]